MEPMAERPVDGGGVGRHANASSIGCEMAGLMGRMTGWRDEPARDHYVRTGFDRYDRRSGGLRMGTLTAIAGGPSMGSDVLALDVARHAALGFGRPTAYSCSSLSRDEVIMRIMSAETGVAPRLLMDGDLDGDEWDRCEVFASFCGDAPLYIDADRDMDVGRFMDSCRGLVESAGLKLAVLDASDRVARNRDVMDSDLRRLAGLAKDLGIAVVATIPMDRNRFPLERFRDRGRIPRPVLADVRYADTVCQHSNTVLVVRRTEFDGMDGGPEKALLTVAKHQWCTSEEYALEYDPQFPRFVEP